MSAGNLGYVDIPKSEGPPACYEGYYQSRRLMGETVPRIDDVRGEAGVRYRYVGFLHNLDNEITVRLLKRQFRQTVDTVQADGTPVRAITHTDDEGAEVFEQITHRGGYLREGADTYLQICGPTVEDAAGIKAVIIDSVELLTPPHLQPPEPIEIEGELTRFGLPGIKQVWPKVGERLVSSSAKWHTDEGYAFNRAWLDGDITTGAKLRIYGYPVEIRGFPGIIPIEWRILSPGTPDDEPHPWDVPLPRTPADLPGPIDKDDQGAGPEHPAEGAGPFGLADGWQNVALASFVLFFLPGMLGDEGAGGWALDNQTGGRGKSAAGGWTPF